MSPCGVISVLGLLQTAAMACLALGSVYLAIVHSASPMQGLSDVMARIESGERSRSALLAGYVLQVVVLVVFMVMLVGVWRWIPSTKPGALDVVDGGEKEVEVRRCVRRAYLSLGVTVGSVAVSCGDHVLRRYMLMSQGSNAVLPRRALVRWIGWDGDSKHGHCWSLPQPGTHLSTLR